MKRSLLKHSLLGVLALALAPVLAQAPAEAPSTVGAVYVEPSAKTPIRPGEKIADLFTRNMKQPYVLQRLSDRSYYFQRFFYSTTFYVGDQGVLLFDPLEARAGQLRKAIAEVTPLPVTALVYSHDHADHIGDAPVFVDAARKSGVKLRIIASKATAEKMAYLKSKLPQPTETVAWPRGAFRFEGLKVSLHGFERGAHTDDHGVWLLHAEKVAHLPDLVNPDQPPFWAFAGSEKFVYYEANVEQLARLDWTWLSGGHGNVGSRADIDFYRRFLGDLKQAVGKALGEVAWGTGVDAATVNAHTAFLPAWLNAVARSATDQLRPKYGSLYGFEAAVARNAEMVAMAMFSYR